MNRVWVVIAAGAALMSCPPPPPTDACLGRVAGDLVITEVMIDPEGTDTGGEWIEFFNTLGTPLDMKGLTLYVRDTDGSGAKTHLIRAGTAPARGYFVVGDIRSGPNPGWINYAYTDGLGSMGNARGVVGIRCGMTTLAEFTYTSAAKAERSRMLNGINEPSSNLASVEANYCDTPPGNAYFGNNSGTPGQANPECMAEATLGTCVDNGIVRAMTNPQAGDLVITEVMARPVASGATTGEWFEVLARAAVDLNDVSINTTTSTTRITNQQCLRVQPGEYVLLARSADAFVNGGLPPPKHVYGTISFSATTNQRISLSRGDAGIDEIALFPSAAGRAWQLDPLKLDPGSNDDPNNFCKAPLKWNVDGGGDYGSPGAANPDCPLDAGQPDLNICFDSVIGADRSIVRPNDGDLVITEWMTNPAAVSDSNGEFIEVMVKNNFDLNGLTLQIGTARVPLNSRNCLAVTANSFLLFGNNGDPASNGSLPRLTASFSEALTGTKTITILGADGGLYDTITPSGTEVSGASQQVTPGFENPTDNDLAANRCRSPNKWNPDGGGDFGSPGVVNPTCAGGTVDAGNQCFDTMLQQPRDLVRPIAGDLVITEWMPNPSTIVGGDGEFFEVLAKSAVDLNGVSVQVGTSAIKTLSSPNCLAVPAGSYLVYAKNSTPTLNGNLPMPTDVFTGALTNSGQTIRVLLPDAGLSDAITYGATGSAAWPQGASMQVKPGFENPADNDLAGNLCVTDAGIRYGVPAADGGLTGDRGTPGLPNICP